MFSELLWKPGKPIMYHIIHHIIPLFPIAIYTYAVARWSSSRHRKFYY